MRHDMFPAKSYYQDLEVAAEYDDVRQATWQQRWMHKTELRALRKAVRELSPEARVLDVACGTGRVWPPLVEHFRCVVGVDISAEMLLVARHRYAGTRNVAFVRADATALPFGDREFDYTFSVRFLGHTPPGVRMAALREMRRVTSNRLIVMVYVTDPLIRLRKLILRLARGKSPVWYPFRSREELLATLQLAGLAATRIQRLAPGVMEATLVTAQRAL